MPSYEELREKHVAQFFELFPEYRDRHSWSPARLRKERENRLRNLLRVARDRSAR